MKRIQINDQRLIVKISKYEKVDTTVVKKYFRKGVRMFHQNNINLIIIDVSGEVKIKELAFILTERALRRYSHLPILFVAS